MAYPLNALTERLAKFTHGQLTLPPFVNWKRRMILKCAEFQTVACGGDSLIDSETTLCPRIFRYTYTVHGKISFTNARDPLLAIPVFDCERGITCVR